MNYLTSGALFILLLVSPSLHADDFSLSARQLPSAEYEAFIGYTHDCVGLEVTNPESVEITGNDIFIKEDSPGLPPCGIVPPPPVPAEAGVIIGFLEPGDYTLTWEQTGDFTLTEEFTVPEGPFVPCTDCYLLQQAPLPESGLWHNPDQSPGSGLNFEIQNGVLAGFFYGYSAAGMPEWQSVSGMLMPSEVSGVLWELETTLIRAEGGSCIDCEFTPPAQITEGAVIRLEFKQRNYVRVSIGEVFDQYFVPFTYGSSAQAYFAEQTPYLFPEFADQPIFVVTIRPDQGADTDVYSWESEHVLIREASVSKVAGVTKVSYGMQTYGPNGPAYSPVPPPFGLIVCEQESFGKPPACRIEIGERIYTMAPANFGDSRFFAESDDGMIIDAHRMVYD